MSSLVLPLKTSTSSGNESVSSSDFISCSQPLSCLQCEESWNTRAHLVKCTRKTCCFQIYDRYKFASLISYIESWERKRSKCFFTYIHFFAFTLRYTNLVETEIFKQCDIFSLILPDNIVLYLPFVIIYGNYTKYIAVNSKSGKLAHRSTLDIQQDIRFSAQILKWKLCIIPL